MSHLQALGAEIAFVVRIFGGFDTQLFDDGEAVTFETHHFFWIIRQQTHSSNPKVDQNLRTDSVFSQVHGVAEFFVRFHGIETFLLQFICVYLCRQTNPSSLLAHVYQNTRTGFIYLLQRSMKLIATVTTL